MIFQDFPYIFLWFSKISHIFSYDFTQPTTLGATRDDPQILTEKNSTKNAGLVAIGARLQPGSEKPAPTEWPSGQEKRELSIYRCR